MLRVDDRPLRVLRVDDDPMTGIEFLKADRGHNLDVPIILMTGAPTLESAVSAVEYGAFRYLA